MSATTPDVPLHPRTDRWVFRSGGESGRVSRAERRGEHRGHEARRACADASEKPDRPWHRTTSSSRIITLRRHRVKAFLSLGEFAHDATAGIFNDYVALQVWAGTPGEGDCRSPHWLMSGGAVHLRPILVPKVQRQGCPGDSREGGCLRSLESARPSCTGGWVIGPRSCEA